ncbi:MAG: carboxylesterase, partial [Pseudomonadota bacterium]
GGMSMRAWYDIYSLDRSGRQDETGIRESADTLTALVEREHGRGIPYARIVVAGFSQGGAIALHMALRSVEPLAGLLALSTWLPLADRLEAEVAQGSSARITDLPVFLAHGSFDPMLPVAMGYETRERLEGLGITVEWHEYPMMHAVCAEEIDDISRWLSAVFDSDQL